MTRRWKRWAEEGACAQICTPPPPLDGGCMEWVGIEPGTMGHIRKGTLKGAIIGGTSKSGNGVRYSDCQARLRDFAPSNSSPCRGDATKGTLRYKFPLFSKKDFSLDDKVSLPFRLLARLRLFNFYSQGRWKRWGDPLGAPP